MKKPVLLALTICLAVWCPAAAAQYAGTPYSGSPAPVPGTIRVENFDNGGEGVAYHDSGPNNAGGAYRQTGVDIESSSAGGYDIGWISAGEWLNYTVSVASAGTYTVQVRVASLSGGSMHVGFNTASNVWKSVAVPATGGWQTWATVSFTATLGAGTQQLTVLSDTGGYNLGAITVSAGSSSAPVTVPPVLSGAPYHGSPLPVPGTIQAEDFDNGGEGVAYHDADATNQGGAYRQTGVDIEAASGGGYDVGWFSAGEWMNYTVTVAAAGTYTVQLRVASPGGGGLHVGFNTSSSVSQAVSVPNSGGWQAWTTVSFTATLGAGTQQMTLKSDTGGFNVDSITIASGSSTPAPPPTQPVSAGGTLLPVIEWNIQINDSSETHARQTMDQLMAQGPRAEVVVIVEAYLAHLSVYIDELQKQTGKTWYGVFGTECAPGNWNGSSCTSQWYQGAAILSTHPITSNSVKFFPYQDCWSSARVGLRAALDVNGTAVQVFAMHLQTGGCQNDATSRYNSMRDLKSWAAGYSAPQLVAGDFNADPDQIDTTQGMSPSFSDSWPIVGTGSRFTALGSNPTMKLDYWFSDAGGRAQAVDSWVITSTGSMSDHFPLHATFLVK
jgi:endonuclease/exonuclease/phosphatase family metal-dependent hydrolase